MPMPSRDAERHALIELRFTGAAGRGVHRADQLVSAIGRFLVEQRGGLGGIERKGGFEPILPSREMIDALRELRMERPETVGLGVAIVLISGERDLQSLDDFSAALAVGGGGRPN